MSFSQNNLSFQDDDEDFGVSQPSQFNSQYNFQDFTLPSQTQASQLDHIGSQVNDSKCVNLKFDDA